MTLTADEFAQALAVYQVGDDGADYDATMYSPAGEYPYVTDGAVTKYLSADQYRLLRECNTIDTALDTVQSFVAAVKGDTETIASVGVKYLGTTFSLANETEITKDSTGNKIDAYDYSHYQLYDKFMTAGQTTPTGTD